MSTPDSERTSVTFAGKAGHSWHFTSSLTQLISLARMQASYLVCLGNLMERTIIRHIYFIKENILIKCSRKDIAWFPRNSQRDPLEGTHVYIYVLNI